jgi:peptidoglycan-N-acetylglucosamine deacetylase
MRNSCTAVLLAVASFVFPSMAAAETACADPKAALGVERIVEIDATNGPLYGDNTRFTREESFLGPKEVVLTFDDGPLDRVTKSILDTLDRHCTKATFFSVGQMALAYPDYAKDVLARGHTLAGHTWSHPMNIGRLPFEKAKDQIERGFAAIALAADQPIAPFFRFPGLNDSDPLLGYLQSRGVATFTVDVISNDSYISSSSRLTQRTLAEVERRNGGIILFHDIKAATARALPDILNGLKAGGYKVVHMRAKSAFVPLPEMTAELKPAYDKAMAQRPSQPSTSAETASTNGASVHQLMPKVADAAAGSPTVGSDVPVTQVTALARTRVGALDPDKPTAPSRKRKVQTAAFAGVDSADGLDAAVKPRQKFNQKLNQNLRVKANKKAPPANGSPFLFPF